MYIFKCITHPDTIINVNRTIGEGWYMMGILIFAKYPKTGIRFNDIFLLFDILLLFFLQFAVFVLLNLIYGQ